MSIIPIVVYHTQERQEWAYTDAIIGVWAGPREAYMVHRWSKVLAGYMVLPLLGGLSGGI